MLCPRLFQVMQECVIDESKIYCPYHEKLEKGVKRVVYSDHVAMMLNLKIDHGNLIRNQYKKEKVWKFDEEGYKNVRRRD